jgi:hypothetical protein
VGADTANLFPADKGQYSFWSIHRVAHRSCSSYPSLAAPSICDRITFASRSPETGLPMGLPEKRAAKVAHAVKWDTLSSPFCGQDAPKLRPFRAILRILQPCFCAVQTAWRRKCDSNSDYRFEFRNPRRLRNLQATQHLTRESISSDWLLGRLRTVHLFVLSLRRTAYDNVAESGQQQVLASCGQIDAR